MTAILRFDGVSKSFQVGMRRIQSLDEVSVGIQPGIITGLIGPDAAGKTTLMRLAAGLLLPDRGEIRAIDIDVVRDPLLAQSSVGYMPQRFGLYEDLSVQENLDLYADLQGVDRDQRAKRYTELMHMTALAPFRKRLAGRLSGGMKQKLGLACTLVRTPRLLILDEPTVGVDPVSRRELWEIIDRLVKQEGLSVLLSTAYLNEAERCDDVIMIHAGRIMGQGTPQSFSEPLRGRSYLASARGLSKRSLQHRLSNVDGVLDAVIEDESVRMVSREPHALQVTQQLSDIPDLEITPAEPNFEDAFVAMLKGSHSQGSGFSVAPHDSSLAHDTVIRVHGLQKHFGDFYAVKDISFEVQRGEVFGLLGANGAGKSTTFRMLCGLLPASAGELSVAGRDLRNATADARSRLGYMAQKFSLYTDLSVMENLNFFARAYGLSRTERMQRIDWALQTFELNDYRNNASGDLPLGYKQRLAMAAALLHQPDILFLDEPTSGVDPLARREFWERINALAESGVTVLVTTHFMDEANYCDRLVIMADGEVLAEGTPTEMKMRFRSKALPAPTMEDAFIGLIEARERRAGKEVMA